MVVNFSDKSGILFLRKGKIKASKTHSLPENLENLTLCIQDAPVKALRQQEKTIVSTWTLHRQLSFLLVLGRNTKGRCYGYRVP